MKNRMKKILSLLTALSLFPSGVIAASDGGVKAEIPYTDRDPKISAYSYDKMDVYTKDNAPNDVPEGYEGYVMKLTASSSSGITVDFSDRHINPSVVKALHMRVYYPDTTKEVRITIDAGYSWVLRHQANSPGRWEDVTLSSQSEIKKLCNASGELGKFGFGFRFYDGKGTSVAYIDTVRVELVESDGVPPVITYDGPHDISMTAGKPLVTGATAFDEYEGRAFPVVAEWSDGSLDGNGLPVEGEHVCTLSATDSFGNRSEIKLNVKVGARDTEPPVINARFDRITTAAGCIPALGLTATDNEDDVSVTETWSDGALDAAGRLTAGEHTLTLTSADLTGNKTEKTVSVTALDSFVLPDGVISEIIPE